MMTVNLEDTEWQQVLAGLARGPRDAVNPLAVKISMQLSSVQQAAKSPNMPTHNLGEPMLYPAGHYLASFGKGGRGERLLLEERAYPENKVLSEATPWATTLRILRAYLGGNAISCSQTAPPPTGSETQNRFPPRQQGLHHTH